MNCVTIGRNPNCDIVINEAHVSGIHLTISLSGNMYLITDNSTNGTIVNGISLNHSSMLVSSGTPIVLAGVVSLDWSKVLSMLSPNTGSWGQTAGGWEQPAWGQMPLLKDDIGIGYGILCFLIPLAGIILYFTWRDMTPNKAKQALIIGLVSIAMGGLGFIFIIIALLNTPEIYNSVY